MLLKKGDAFESIGVKPVRIDGDAVYLKFDGIDDRDQAEKLRGQLLYIDRAHAVELDDDANFIVDLIGLDGVDDEGGRYGKLVDVMQPRRKRRVRLSRREAARDAGSRAENGHPEG